MSAPEDDTLCKMRVLMFGWEYPPYAAGGLATATISLANGLVRQGHSVTLVVPFPAAAEAGGVRVVSASELSPNLRVLRVASELLGSLATVMTSGRVADRSDQRGP